jgi:hypothetical protein
MSAKGKVQALLDLVDAEADFPLDDQRWLKADQPTIAAKLGCAPRTLRNIIKDPAFVTHRTRLGGKNFTLIRRADPKAAIPKAKSANRQSGTAKSATKPAAKPAKIDATLEHQKRREELRQIWLAHQFRFSTDRVPKAEYGLLLQIAKLGITPDEFRYVLDNWKLFLIGVNALYNDPVTLKSDLKKYQPKPWLGTIVQFPEAVHEVYQTHKQWEDGYKLQKQLEQQQTIDQRGLPKICSGLPLCLGVSRRRTSLGVSEASTPDDI